MRALAGLAVLLLIAFVAGAACAFFLTPRAVVATSNPVIVLPVARITVTSLHGRRGLGHHAGVDLRAREGEPLYAIAPGVVEKAHVTRRGGKSVVLGLRSGWRAGYAHLSRVDVARGDTVLAGTQVGLAGSTGHASGPHLHFELRDPRSGRLVDPLPYLRAASPSAVRQVNVAARSAVRVASALQRTIRRARAA